ncbi:MAG: hypothetical protein ACLFVL_06775 [Candidatus Aenigmatarchaeota archaeon]
MIEFEEEIEENRFYDPTASEVKQEKIVIRKDPLTGKSCRILEKPLPISKEVDIEEEIEGGFCPFCPDKVYDIGARDSGVLDNELLEKREAILLSNINPYAERSLVIRLTEKHYLPLEDFEMQRFTDALELTVEYLDRSDNGRKYPVVMMNYLKPAGSSVVHPHLQLLVSRSPPDYQKRMMNASEDYHKKHSENYWVNLLEEEKDGERYIGKIGRSEWKTPFAPRGLEHVQGISLKDLRSMRRKDLQNISSGIVNTLEYYAEEGLNSFNLSIILPPDGDTEKFATVVDIVARSNFDRYYWCDVFALNKLLDEPYSNRYPEEITKDVKPFFEKEFS